MSVATYCLEQADYTPHLPWGMMLLTFIQFLASISVRESPERHASLYHMQVPG